MNPHRPGGQAVAAPISSLFSSLRPVAAVLLLGAALLAAAPPARAQKYPERPVRVVNTFPAGGSGDAVLRIVFEKVGAAMGQSFIIDTRTGAAGSIGTANVAASPNDGYSLLLGTASTFGTNSATMKSLPYDPVRDFTPVVMIATTPYLLLTHPSVPAQNLREMVAHAKANPGKLNYGSFGIGSSNHLTYELLREATGMDIVHVPYKGGALLITALLAGEVQSSMDVYATAYQHVKNGKFRLLGVASAKRFSLLPDSPTLTEQGAPVEGGTFFALLGPAKMPAPIVEALNREVNRAIAIPEVKERLAGLGAEPVGGTPEALAGTINREIQKWAALVKARNLKFE
jgi:tripartite-type tricarboxylate transporter receptor subunit TctC